MTPAIAMTWVGQTLALVALTAACVRLPGCRTSAAARYVAWLAALLLGAALLAWPLIRGAGDAAVSVAPLSGAGVADYRYAPVVIPAPIVTLSRWLGLAWALGAGAGIARCVRDIVRVMAVKHRAVPLSGEEGVRLGFPLPQTPSRRVPRVCWCDDLESPAVLGFASPVIALPRHQVACLSDDQARGIVLHELAHVRRRDDWWALAEHLVVALTWVNPAMHVVRRRLAAAREMACDEWVVRRTGSPAAYARCLVEVAGLRSRQRRLRLATAVTGRPSMLRQRVAGVLSYGHRPPSPAAALLAWLAPVASSVIALGLLQLPPVFVTSQPRAVAPMPVSDGGMAVSPDGAPVEASSPALRSFRPADAEHRGAPSRRSAAATPIEAVHDTVNHGMIPASAPPGGEPEQVSTIDRDPLLSRPVAGAGDAGVAAAHPGPGAEAPGAVHSDNWWSGPAGLGASAGDAAATAGRTTASIFKRVGSSVPRLLGR